MPRPTSVTVFGVLNLVFGGLGVLGVAFTAVIIFSGVFARPQPFVVSPVYEIWTRFAVFAGLISSVLLGLSGIGLLRMRPWGRVLAIGYAMYAVVMTVVSFILQWMFVLTPMLDELAGKNGAEEMAMLAGAIGGGIGGCVGLIHPVLLWFFMTRPRVVAAFGSEVALQVDNQDPAMAPTRNDHSNPYHSPTAELTATWPDQSGPGDSIIETFVPSKNGSALAAYYLGIFALFPLLGFPLGVTAIYFGIKGLRRVRQDPTVRGGAHAWTGIICGSLFGLFNFLLLALAVIGLVGAAMSNR